jgi:recombinational DNA repair protein (RecF pathway)
MMTLETRHTFAASQSSSIVALFSRKHSRRAWIANSVPTFDQNLKQSATVFAGLLFRVVKEASRKLVQFFDDR